MVTAQSLHRANSAASIPAHTLSSNDERGATTNSRDSLDDSTTDAEDELPFAPEPTGGGYDHYEVAPAATWHQVPFSRIGIGANINPLGVGIQSAIVLNHYFDARLVVNFFDFNTGRYEIEGFNTNTDLHMFSTGALLDYYPLGSVFRISPGLMFYNGNQITGNTAVVPGTSFKLNNTTYYSATPNPARGAVPLAATGGVNLNRTKPAFMLTGGFGKVIPRSNRHWSFPFEIGALFMGSPTLNVNVTGWACLNARQTICGDVDDPTNPVAIAFNRDLNSQLAKYRKDLAAWTVYPIISSSVVYSFNIR